MASSNFILTEHMQDDIWMVMHMVAEMGAHPEAVQFSEKRRFFECELREVEEVDGIEEDGIEEDSHIDQDERKKVLIDVAEQLRKIADSQDFDQAMLVKDIVDCIRTKGDKIKVPMKLSHRPTDNIFTSGLISLLYSDFKSRLENFLGEGEGLNKIAIVSRVTKGVSAGLKDSSDTSVFLVASFATKFISDKYGSFLQKNGGITKLVLDRNVDSTSYRQLE